MKYKNYGKEDRILCGSPTVRFEPGAVVDIDPKILERYAPEDVKDIRPFKQEAPKKLKGKPVVEEPTDPNGLIDILTQANAVPDNEE